MDVLQAGLQLLSNWRKDMPIRCVFVKLVVVSYGLFIAVCLRLVMTTSTTPGNENLLSSFFTQGRRQVILLVFWKPQDCLLLGTGQEETGCYFRDGRNWESHRLPFRGTWSPTTSWWWLEWRERTEISHRWHTGRGWQRECGCVHICCFAWLRKQEVWESWLWGTCQWNIDRERYHWLQWEWPWCP